MANTYFDGAHDTHVTAPFGIFADQAGYIAGRRKFAAMTFPAEHFSLVNRNGDIVYEHEVTHAGMDECSGDDVYIADLTAFDIPGTYRICAKGQSSATFHIGSGSAVYGKVLRDMLKAFYYLRCGCGLDERYAGKFAHPPCHDRDALIFGTDTRVDVCGGWHDAGDYGRYVTAGASACAQLLYAYRLCPHIMENTETDIPESAPGMPDVLRECRFELEWLMKMQRADGAVYHKVTTMIHAPFIMPEDDKDELYLFPISTSATADLCAVCALAAGVYADLDSQFSQTLKAAAERAYSFLEDHPGWIEFRNPDGCNTGEYGDSGDIDKRYWAAAEMYALTGEMRYHTAFRHYSGELEKLPSFIRTALGYWAVGGFGTLAYIFSEHPDKDEKYAQELKNAISGEGYWLADKVDKCGYGAAMDTADYFWGSNMKLAHNGIILALSASFTGDKRLKRAADEQIHVLLGRNALGISYVTGCGEYCCCDLHLRPAFADGVDECIPGMVSGGPNRELNDWKARRIIKPGTPPMKCFVDDHECFSLNEVTIYWNAAAVLLLALTCGE